MRLAAIRITKRGAHRQEGMALMVMLVILMMGTLAILASSLNVSLLKATRQETTSTVLAQAKEALIGRAVSDATLPGSLPCPDTNNDGSAELLSGNSCPSYIGRLPWRTLKLADLRDSDGERLWYALSPNFRDDDSARPLNSNVLGQLTVRDASGNILAGDVIAIVFAPGAAINGQSRDGANTNTVANFLDGNNADGDTDFISTPASDTFNDRLLAISGDNLWPIVEKRIGSEVKKALGEYYIAWSAYPFAAPFADPANATFIGQPSPATYNGLLPMGAVWTSVPAYSLSGGNADVSCELRVGYNNLANARARCYISDVVGSPTITITGTLAGLRLWRPHNLGEVKEVRVRVNGTNFPAASVTGMGANISYTINANGSVAVTFTGKLFAGVERIELRDVVVDSSVNPVDPAYAWFTRNRWNQVIYYSVSPGYVSGSGNACNPLPSPPYCLMVSGSGGGDDKRAVIVMTGAVLPNQLRPSGAITDYLEDENATPADFIYENKARAASFNDQVVVIAP